jgi:hypothetical protein
MCGLPLFPSKPKHENAARLASGGTRSSGLLSSPGLGVLIGRAIRCFFEPVDEPSTGNSGLRHGSHK